jgi:hypothetical protein
MAGVAVVAVIVVCMTYANFWRIIGSGKPCPYSAPVNIKRQINLYKQFTHYIFNEQPSNETGEIPRK